MTMIFFSIVARLGILVLTLGLPIYGIYYLFKSPSSMEQSSTTNRTAALRSVYLYLAAFVGLMMIIVGASSLISLTLKATIFVKADYYPGLNVEDECSSIRLKETPTVTHEQCAKKVNDNIAMALQNKISTRHSSLAENLGLLIIGAPLFAYHFMTAQRERHALKK